MANGRARRMSTPPPGGWPPGPPPNSGQPYGQQPFNPQHPPGWQQGQWPQQPSPPPQKGNSLKWLLVAVAVLLVVAISVGATLLFTRDGGGGGGSTPSSGAASDFASAGDTGPVALITSEPTCAAYITLSNRLADAEGNGWSSERASLGESSSWTPDQRSRAEAVTAAMRTAADQAVPLARQTPHRLVRELYQQFIVYGRAYADKVSTYKPQDDDLASANVNAGAALVGLCNTVIYGAAGRAVAVESSMPTTAGLTGDQLSDLHKFVSADDEKSCSTWVQREAKLTADTPDWQNIDMSLASTQWTSDRRAIEMRVRPLLVEFADDTQEVGRRSGNPVLEDFAVASAIYIKAYVTVGDSYDGSADGWLSYTGLRIANLVTAACGAAAG